MSGPCIAGPDWNDDRPPHSTVTVAEITFDVHSIAQDMSNCDEEKAMDGIGIT